MTAALHFLSPKETAAALRVALRTAICQWHEQTQLEARWLREMEREHVR